MDGSTERRFLFFNFFTPTLLFPPEELKHEIYVRIEREEIRATWDSAKRILGVLFNSFHIRTLQLSGKTDGEARKIRAGCSRGRAGPAVRGGWGMVIGEEVNRLCFLEWDQTPQ